MIRNVASEGVLSPARDDTAARVTLAVRLTDRSARDIEWLAKEEDVNKSTLVNRAIQFYRVMAETQRNGGAIFIQDHVQGSVQRIWFL